MTRKQFVLTYKMPIWDVNWLCQMRDRVGEYSENMHSGEPHQDATNKENKAECGRLWGEDADRTMYKMLEVAQQFGFTGIESNGIYPTLKRGADYVEIPE